MKRIDNTSLWPSFSRTYHPIYKATEITFERGEGAHLFDVEGKRYFDAFSTLWTNLIGHGRTEVITAMSDQSKRLSFMHLFSGADHEPALELADRLVQLSPFGHSKVFFGCSGSDATETAIKMARAYWFYQGQPEKNVIVSRRSSYHGVGLGALGIMGFDSYQEPFQPLPNGTHRVSARDINALEKYFESVNAKKHVAAFFFEPVITSDGLIVVDQSYWDSVKRLCRDYEVLLVADEVSTGMGRTGEWFASSLYSLSPDILYLAKSLTGGYAPLSAVLTTERIFQTIHQGDHYFLHGSTFAGHPVSCVAALKVIEIIEREGLVDRSKILGECLRSELEKLKSIEIPYELHITGVGTLFEIVLVSKGCFSISENVSLGMELYRELLIKGQYVRVLANDICIAPPLISTEQEIKQLGSDLFKAIEKVCGGRK